MKATGNEVLSSDVVGGHISEKVHLTLGVMSFLFG
jgi:hypothetical protein